MWPAATRAFLPNEKEKKWKESLGRGSLQTTNLKNLGLAAWFSLGLKEKSKKHKDGLGQSNFSWTILSKGHGSVQGQRCNEVFTLCEVPTREKRPDNNTENYVRPTLFDKCFKRPLLTM